MKFKTTITIATVVTTLKDSETGKDTYRLNFPYTYDKVGVREFQKRLNKSKLTCCKVEAVKHYIITCEGNESDTVDSMVRSSLFQNAIAYDFLVSDSPELSEGIAEKVDNI